MEFRVGITRDFLKPDGSLGFGDIGLGLLDQNPDPRWEFLPEACDEIAPEVADEYDALLVLAPRVTARTVDACRRLSLIARFGVGYDNVDVDACTRNGVMLSITPQSVRRPVATSALAFLLALSHKLLIKDRLTRSGRWQEKLDYMGMGLTGRTLGMIGLGNIGRELLRLTAPLEMRHVAFDPYITGESAAAAGVELLALDTLLMEADFVVVCCALTGNTRHLIDRRRLKLMKPTSYLINIARGPIVDQAALSEALVERRIAGAALDVFETEPVSDDDPLLKLDNVIVAPHAIAWTDELFLGNGRAACQSILDVAQGRIPAHIVNRQVREHPALKEKLNRNRS
ncbi:MAG TPA: NAD(P)-dependent oxidoreductase [Pirellulales bacterium]|nr:NAD(P)-dependent oxidoreductase [Pirellulales bacterium]